MPFTEDQDMIQTVATEGPDQALSIRVLPGRPRCDRAVANPHRPNSIRECLPKGAIIVAHQIGRCRAPRECLHDLLRQPLRGRVPGHREPEQLARPCPNTRNANRHSNVRVGTTQRSIAAMAAAWLRRNVRHVCDGGPRRRIMYLETVDSAISNPSLSGSPWMRGAPYNGFSLLIRWMSSRSSHLTLGLPARPRDFQRQ
jgi:hypothetical protein